MLHLSMSRCWTGLLTRSANDAKDGGFLPNLGSKLKISSWLTCLTRRYSMASCSLSVRSRRTTSLSKRGAVAMLSDEAALRCC